MHHKTRVTLLGHRIGNICAAKFDKSHKQQDCKITKNTVTTM